ncbi:alpha/beta hydrolase [uncultured Mucilaginibacter sp.]|uniref:alpha/beta hydrolase n=1 Tax=uncultured Mucilaginibacter sp. TaxID=797541 RepID=UPI002600628A|nr:alpha/beta hydrolase [uncultured Mucilaginibacter sp.]
MRKYLLFALCIAFIACISVLGCSKGDIATYAGYVCPTNRFTTQTFTFTSTTVTFGQAPDYTGKNQTLQMLINQPASDTLARRPLIIYCHGGGFTGGTRSDAWPNKFCQSFTKMGYVTASIDYRLGIGPNGDADVIAAQVRAVQDAKAAVRYFKQTAVEQGNPYRIDTAQIFIAGESSGAIIALQMGFLNNVAEFSAAGDHTLLSNLGGLEGSTNTAPYSSKITGVIGLSGAILDIDWINNPVPLIMVHGSKDASIPYHSGVVSPFTTTMLYGSYLIDSAATSQSFNSKFYTFKGAGATPYVTSNTYADSTINFVSKQLYSLIDCERLGQH